MVGGWLWLPTGWVGRDEWVEGERGERETTGCEPFGSKGSSAVVTMDGCGFHHCVRQAKSLAGLVPHEIWRLAGEMLDRDLLSEERIFDMYGKGHEVRPLSSPDIDCFLF